MGELAECIKLDLHKPQSIRVVERGGYGSSTLTFMRLEDENLDLCLFGSGGYLIFRDNILIESYGSKPRCPPQIAINGSLIASDMHLKRVKVQKDDVAVLFSDGLFGKKKSDLDQLIYLIAKHFLTEEDINRAIFSAFQDVACDDDKTLAILHV